MPDYGKCKKLKTANQVKAEGALERYEKALKDLEEILLKDKKDAPKDK